MENRICDGACQVFSARVIFADDLFGGECGVDGGEVGWCDGVRAKKEDPLLRRYVFHSIGSDMIVIWSLLNILLGHLATMYMTTVVMIVNTQETFALRIRAFPAFRRSLYLFCHRYSFLARSPNGTVVKISCHCLGHKDLRNPHEVHQLYHLFSDFASNLLSFLNNSTP